MKTTPYKHSARGMGQILVFLILTGCSLQPSGRGAYAGDLQQQAEPQESLINDNYTAADKLVDQIQGVSGKLGPIVVASLADIGNLNMTTAFGKISSEQIASRLAQRGIAVADVRLRANFAVAPEVGESGISEDVARLKQGGSARSFLVGTYADTGQEILVSIKLIRIEDAVVVAAVDYTVKVDRSLYDNLFLTLPKKPDTTSSTPDKVGKGS